MNRRRYEQLAQGLNSIASKVLNTVPMREPWTFNQIGAELRRLGCTLDHRVINGSLATLEEIGLVRRSGMKSWIRVPVKDPEPTNAHTEEAATVPTYNSQTQVPAAPKPKATLDTLADLSSRLRSMAKGMNQLASDIDDAAIGIAEQMQANQDKVDAARKLTQLLKQMEG